MNAQQSAQGIRESLQQACIEVAQHGVGHEVLLQGNDHLPNGCLVTR
jgi:hypothetical protein